MPTGSIRWTNPSVLGLAGADDPVAVIEKRARELVLAAFDTGWAGPPFNPLKIAKMMGIAVEANASVTDARTVPCGDKVKIEFNPMQVRERARFSLAHEVAHALFPDVGDQVRHRGGTKVLDDWQLETLCNVAAAEFVMPLGSLPPVDNVPPIETLMMERRKFDVSAEAFLIRIAKVSREPLVMFVASKADGEKRARLEYVISSSTVPRRMKVAGHVPEGSVVEQCAAIGQTLSAAEVWDQDTAVFVECVGIPGHSGSKSPRVAGLIHVEVPDRQQDRIKLVHGDVLRPGGAGLKIVCQLVNDRSKTWGGGVARSAARKYPAAHAAYQEWFASLDRSHRLGAVHMIQVESDVILASLIAQEGFGPSDMPRIRYAALERALSKVAEACREQAASVHMPRLGGGASGGVWQRVEELVREIFATEGLDVAVYDLPPKRGDYSLFE